MRKSLLMKASAIFMVTLMAFLNLSTNVVFANNTEGLRVNGYEGFETYGTSMFAADSADIQPFVLETAYDGFVSSFAGTYAMEIQTAFGIEYIPVGKLTIDLTNEAEVTAALLRDDLSAEMRNDILELRQEVLDGLVDELSITIFSETLIEESMIQPLSRRYLTYNGLRMRTDTTFINGRNTGWQNIQRGTSTNNVARNIRDTALIVAGHVSNTVGFADSLISAWQIWVNSGRPHTITASNQDFLQMRLVFDEQRQRTYGNILGGWSLGVTTQRITLRQIGLEQHYFNNGNGSTHHHNRSTSAMAQSEDFSFPWTTAFGNMGLRPIIINQWVRWRVHNSTFVFS